MYIKNKNFEFAKQELLKKYHDKERLEDRFEKAINNNNTEKAKIIEKRLDLIHAEISAQIELFNNFGFFVNLKLDENGYTKHIEIVEKF